MAYPWRFLMLQLIAYSCTDNNELPQGETCQPGTSQIYIMLSTPPLFEDCQYLDLNCSEEKIDEFVSKNINYPPLAFRNRIEGDVVVEGITEKHGCFSIEDVIESLGYGCDEEAIRLIKLMPPWKPGQKIDNPERLRTHLTIKFRLD